MKRLSILGSGGPMPGNDRHGESYVLQLGDDRLLFDCGPATTHKLLAMGMHPTQIDNLFFTHHHMDHDIDYPCFLLTRWDSGAGKENRLSVWGPKLTEQLTERILDQELGDNQQHGQRMESEKDSKSAIKNDEQDVQNDHFRCGIF